MSASAHPADRSAYRLARAEGRRDPLATARAGLLSAVSRIRLLVLSFRYSFGSTGSVHRRWPANPEPSKEPAVFIGRVIVIAVFGAYMMLRRRRRR